MTAAERRRRISEAIEFLEKAYTEQSLKRQAYYLWRARSRCAITLKAIKYKREH